MNRLSWLFVFVAIFCGVNPAFSDVDPWEQFQPPPDTKYDWIQLNSGEWLKGDLKAMYDYNLEFDSDELDLLDLDFEDVRQIRTRNPQMLLVEKGRRNMEVLTGMLVMKENKVTVVNAASEIELPRDSVVSIVKGAQRERDYWSGMASIGVNMRGGNSTTTDTTIMANIKRRTALTRFNFDYLANYSKSEDTETANNQRINGNIDVFLTSRFYWQLVAGEFYRDPFTNIDDQYSLYTGIGYDIIHSKRTDWTVGVGGGYQSTRYVSVSPGDDEESTSPFLTASTIFDYEISGNIDYLFDYSMRFLNESNGTYTHHMLTKLSVDLIKDLDLDISFIWDRTQKPQAAADGSVPEKDDHQLIFSLAYDF